MAPKKRNRNASVKKVNTKSRTKKVIKIQYQSQKKLTNRIIYPIGVYASENIWCVPAFDYGKQTIRLFRAYHIIEVEDAEGNFEPVTETLNDILYSYKIKDPIHLYVKLSENGIVRCKDNPYFETNIQYNSDATGGFIDATIDKADLNFVSNFFMSLGDEAQVIDPLEIREFILASARKLLEQYS